MKTRKKIVFFLALIAGSTASSAFLGGMIKNAFDWWKGVIRGMVEMGIGLVVSLLTWNPDTTLVRPLIEDFVEMLVPLYIIAFMITGLYFFFYSESPKGRAKARSALLKLLISIVFVLVAEALYALLLDVSELLVNFIIKIIDIDYTNLTLFITGLPLLSLLITGFFLLTLLVMYAARYAMLLIMAAVFPLVIFFFFFDYTKDYGRKFMQFTLTLIFTPVTQAAIFVFFLTTFSNMSFSLSIGSDLAQLCLCIAALVLMILAPLITMGFLEWLGGILGLMGFVAIVNHQTMRAASLFFVGSLFMGEGPGALPLAATMYFVTQLEHVGEHAGEQMLGEHGPGYRSKIRGNYPGKGSVGPRRPPGGGGGGGHGGDGGGPRRPPTSPLRSNKTYMERGDACFEEGARLNTRGRTKAGDAKLEEGIRHYQSALSAGEAKAGELSNIERAELHGRIGDSQLALGRLDSAVESYSTAKGLDSKNPKYDLKLADTFLKRG